MARRCHRFPMFASSSSTARLRNCRTLLWHHAVKLCVLFATVSWLASSCSTAFAQNAPSVPNMPHVPCALKPNHGWQQLCLPHRVIEEVRGFSIACFLCFLTAFLAAPIAVWAQDRTVSPPTCPNAFRRPCAPRIGDGALQTARENLAAAQQKLHDAEERAGSVLLPGADGFNGVPELVEFWRDETQRLEFNRAYLERVRSQMSLGGATSSTANPAKSLKRIVSRLVVQAPDVEKEARFWCEACGMQRYGILEGGGVLVSYGPPGVVNGDEGGFFAIEVRPAANVEPINGGAEATGPRLSYLQICTPVQFRQYKVEQTGGEDLGGYGFYYYRSPAGVTVRAYIGDRRDPVEFVALVADKGDQLKLAERELEAMGLREDIGYSRPNEYMPRLPYPNKTYVNGEPELSAQVLLLPFQAENPAVYKAAKSTEQILSGEEDDYEPMEQPFSPVSTARGVRLVTLGPHDEVIRNAAANAVVFGTDDGAGIMMELHSVVSES